MAKLERTYNVPLRRGFVNTPRYKRAKKAVNTLKSFLSQHMKSDNVKLGQHLNNHLWHRGIKNPPHHVKVKAVKDDEGIVRAELEGFEYTETVRPEEAEPEQGLAQKLMGGGAKEEKKTEKENKGTTKKTAAETQPEKKADSTKQDKPQKKAEEKGKKEEKKASSKKAPSKKSSSKKKSS